MKILLKSQAYFAILGLSSDESKQEFHLNHKILLGLILIGYSLTACVLYLVYVANSFDKYIECICTIVAIFVIGTSFVSVVFGMNILYECIDNIENLIDTSK